ncbi:DUF3089 domain-containing protein [Arenicella xantha]|uniref:DUF3089 family protein n=1 Tax=Arenicella xantha TaxID=644221 RepID=A0A395JPM5_9GAMM|nr:DUF3089 domain-containing protein [Arenicella xantha]RBP53594.1 DUF3089 family protein [Arenicella xantha]
MLFKNSPIKRAVLVAVLLIGGLLAFHKQIIAWYINPPVDFSIEQVPAAPDYSQLAFWSAHPGVNDSADLAPDGVTTIVPEQAPVDVFFVQPTTYFSGGSWNSAMSTNEFAEQGTEHVLATVASTFSSCCRVYAPRYRQAHLAAFIKTGSPAAIQALDLAYQDVEQAFLYFLKHRDPARPFILASHSQGTLHSLRLLANHVDGKALRKSMVAAYLIGYWIPSDALTVTIPNIPLCTEAGMTGCLVTYDTYDVEGTGRDPDGVLPYWYPSGWEWANRPRTLCVNPLSWKVDQQKVPKQANLGAVPMQWKDAIPELLKNQNPGFKYTTIGAPMVGYTSARCHQDGSLMVDPQLGSPFDNRGAGEDRSLHPNDWTLFHMNIRQNAADRVQAYMQSASVAVSAISE